MVRASRRSHSELDVGETMTILTLFIVAFAAFFTGAAWGVSVEAKHIRKMLDETKPRMNIAK